MAPLYDAVTTRVFPRLKRDRMALKLNGKDDRLRRADFRAFASTASLKAADADAAIDELVVALARALDRIALPAPLSDGSAGADVAERMRAIVRERLEGFA
jgi:serine/threonine-protein kinase HipA